MATAVRGLRAVRVYLDMIKFEHSIFALPFAMIGMMWAAGWPGWRIFGWVVVAMISCRSSAMAFNRIVDRQIDAVNPRTATRAIPSGHLKLKDVHLFFTLSCAIFFVSAWMLNPLAFALSPIALGVTLCYSFTKRYTPLCHFALGLSLGTAPAAAWIGAAGVLRPQILPIVGAVVLWTAGFDIIYALQDDEFDCKHGLRSIPETYGRATALWISRICHALAVLLLAYGGALNHAGVAYLLGVALAAGLLTYEQSLVRPNDLTKVNLAFFTLNGFVSIGVFVFALADRLLR